MAYVNDVRFRDVIRIIDGKFCIYDEENMIAVYLKDSGYKWKQREIEHIRTAYKMSGKKCPQVFNWG